MAIRAPDGANKNAKAQRDDAFPHLVRQLVSCRLRPLKKMMTSSFIHSIYIRAVFMATPPQCIFTKKGGMVLAKEVHWCWK